MEQKTIVVTGGAGFIGSGIVRGLNDRGHTQVVIVDDLGTDDKWKNLVGKTFTEIVPISRCFEWVNEHGKEVSAYIHLGACSSTVERDADYLYDNNTRFSQRLFLEAKKRGQRFIYASSAATYGSGEKGFSDAHEGLETLEPLNMYGMSKHLFDLWLLRNGDLDKVVGLKYFNVFGPNEWHKGRMASAIYHMVPKIQQEGVVKLFASNDPNFGDGEQKRDFIYVKDAVRMTLAFLDNTATGIYNIGMGQANTWNRLSHAMFTALDKPANFDYIPMPEDLIGKYQNYTCADMGKTRQAIGAAADCVELEETVADYIQGHLLRERPW
ncbi:MAG: ADP-glyceromanno-heptose 6-epimerase [Chlamydiia bacterium]|nr:ADP-glyceromanno-heptose 6-epimerase [Chlamydiia bacterium]